MRLKVKGGQTGVREFGKFTSFLVCAATSIRDVLAFRQI